MLDDNLKAQLKAYLERVKLPFVITASLAEGQSSQEMHEFLQDIVGLTDKITLRTDGTDTRRPSFTLARPGEAERIRFAAIPMGHEFTSLVLALLQVGGHPPKIEQELIDQIKGLEGELRFETYVPDVPQLPGRRPGAEPAGGAQPAHPERGHRRRPVPAGSREPPGAGGADGVPQRRAFRPGP